MTSTLPQAEYKATLIEEHFLSLLELLVPNLPEEQKEEILSKGRFPERQRTPEDLASDGTASRLDCMLLPYLQNPVLLLKDGRGKIRGLEFRAIREHFDAFKVYELAPGTALEHYHMCAPELIRREEVFT